MAHSIPQIKAALKKHAGVVVLAANDLGMNRSSLWQRIQTSVVLQEFKAQVEDELLDVAEAVIADAIMKKDKATTRWYLERKGRNRGFTTRTELTGPNGSPIAVAQKIEVTVSYVDAVPAAEPEEPPI